ncbi:MAG: exonuclease domain-containing protein [Pseudomonadota bacterium]
MSQADSLCPDTPRARSGLVLGIVLNGTQPTAFVDLETTGASSRGHAITEIGIVCVDANGRAETWSTLINPGRAIPPGVRSLTGITDDMVADAPAFCDVAAEIRARLDGHLFVAHNVSFDYSFLKSAFNAVDLPFRMKRLCTVKLSRQLYPDARGHSLDALMQRHALTCEPRHRALTDAKALHEFCIKAQTELGRDAMRSAVRTQLDGPALPEGVHKQDIARLPEGPGVYHFYAKDNTLLYVGKSVHVRSRVLGHFGAAIRDDREARLFRQTARVEATRCAGELGALLLEVRTIKERQPVYNRRLRHRADVFTLAIDETGDYHRPRVQAADPMTPEIPQYGLYRQKSGAVRALKALCDDHGLCRKRLGLERGQGSCFGLQIDRCEGACIGKQSAVAWNLKLLGALGKTRLPAWPFDGPVAIGEGRGAYKAWHVVDRWCWYGTAQNHGEFDELMQNETEFDVDVFRILERFLARCAGRASVEPLTRSTR